MWNSLGARRYLLDKLNLSRRLQITKMCRNTVREEALYLTMLSAVTPTL